MENQTRIISGLVVTLSGLLFVLIARGAGAISRSGQESVAPLTLETTPTRTMVPTVTGFPSRTPTVTPTPTSPGTSTPAATPSSWPGEPTLIYPVDGGLLPQPVPPGEWYFEWEARHDPCFTRIAIYGPGSRRISAERHSGEAYEFPYTTHSYLPDDALGPWFWMVKVDCPLGGKYSESRTFWVRAAEMLELYCPWVEK